MISKKRFDIVIAVHADNSWIEVTVPRGVATQDSKDEALALLKKILGSDGDPDASEA